MKIVSISFYAVLRIRADLNTDPDPAFEVNMDLDPDPGFFMKEMKEFFWLKINLQF